MMKKSYFIVSVVIFFLALGVGFILLQKQPEKISLKKTVSDFMGIKKEDAIDYKASFAIFTHGTFRIFTSPMYHNLSEDVFIQANNPNVVHVKKSNLTWNDFFSTLPFKLTKTCLITGTGETLCTGNGGTLKFYLNGVRNDDLLDKPIDAGTQALITFGNEDSIQIKRQLLQIPEVR